MKNDVWVIDDDRSIRWVLERALRKANLDVTLFESANNAMSALASDTPQVIITDLRMPGMDGLEAARHLTEMDEPPAIIFTTAYSEHA